MGAKNIKGRVGKSKVIRIVEPEGDEPKYPKVKGVFLQEGLWLCSMNWKGKRKRISCGQGLEGYKKAVELRVKFNRLKLERKMKDFLRENN